jgi:DNA-binding transcriptional ArsR family regulator
MTFNENCLTISKGEDEVEVLDFLQVKKASLILRAINNTTRQRILRILENQTGLTVTEIQIVLRVEQSVVSQHLATLRRAQVVTTRRQGKYIYYGLNNSQINHINECIENLF